MTRILYLLIPIIIVAMIVIWFLGLDQAINSTTLMAHREAWRAWVAAHPVAARCLYVAVYVAATGLSLPSGGMLTLAGGVLFGAIWGAILAVLSASLGAVVLFLLVRRAAVGLLVERARPLLLRLQPALQRDGFWGMLAMRLVPIVPFWVGNLAPALLGIGLGPFTAATVLGIIPATTMLAGLGATLPDFAAPGATLLSSRVLLPILGMACLSIVPIVLRRIRGARGAA